MSQKPRYVFTIDLGTTYTASLLGIGNSPPQVLKHTGEGTQIETGVFIDEAGVATVGRKARMHGYRQPENYFALFKRLIPVSPYEPVRDGGPCPVDLMAAMARYAREHVEQLIPDIAEAFKSDQVKVVATHPESFRGQEQQALKRAFELAGYTVHQFVSEPVAGIHWYRRDFADRLAEGDLLFVSDVGGGTTDHTVLRFNNGVFDAVLGDRGDPQLGGLNWTGQIFKWLCEEVGVPQFAACYNPQTGLDLSGGSEGKDGRVAILLWQKAEEAKIALSSDEQVDLFVEMPGGLQDVTLTKATMLQLCREQYEAYERAIDETLQGSGHSWSDIKHVLLIGGSAALPNLRESLAKATLRSIEEVFANVDSASVVAEGAAYLGYSEEQTVQVLPGGVAARVRLDGSGQDRFKFFFTPGHAMSPRGETVEDSGQFVDAPGGPCTIALDLAEAKPQAVIPEANGTRPLAKPEQINLLRSVRQTVELPKGRQELILGFDYSRGQLKYRIGFKDLPDAETICGSVLDEETNAATTVANDIILAIDVSRSMEGYKLQQAKLAAQVFTNLLDKDGVQVGIVSFGSTVDVVTPLSRDRQTHLSAIDSLSARGGTPMAEALAKSRDLFDSGEVSTNKLVVLLSDGHPNASSPVREEATRTHDAGIRVVTIGVGKSVAQDLLQYHVASTPNDYRFVDDAAELANVLDQIAHLYVLADKED